LNPERCWPVEEISFTVKAPMTYEAFCGGVFETNCYLVPALDGWIGRLRGSMDLARSHQCRN